jgi:hypothetical protein
MMLNMSPCTLKLDEQKSKYVGLAKENGFGPTFLYRLLRLLKDIKVVHLLEKIVMNLIWLPPFVFD